MKSGARRLSLILWNGGSLSGNLLSGTGTGQCDSLENGERLDHLFEQSCRAIWSTSAVITAKAGPITYSWNSIVSANQWRDISSGRG